jgi:ADP-ribose pyrophosphatase
MKHTIISEESKFKGSVFSVTAIKVALPDGKYKTYELVEIQNAVTILPIDSESNVYFVNQYRIGSKKHLLELPAGKIESGEDPQQTAEREVREEVGMAAGKMHLVGKFYMSPGYASEYMHCFLATDLYQAPLTPDMDEFINVRKIPLSEVYKMIEEGEIEDSKTLAAFALAKPFL